MSTIQCTELDSSGSYTLLDELPHSRVAEFAKTYYWERKTWLSVGHLAMTVLIFAGIIATAIHRGLSLDATLTQAGLGFITFFLLLPPHELLHGAVYKLFGAPRVSFHASFKKMYFYALADRFVADTREFVWVASVPMILLTSITLLLAVFVPHLRVFFLASSLLHLGGCSGDVALLSYLWHHRTSPIFTYDDAAAGKSYFYRQNNSPYQSA
jgi:hypothetical protein